MPDHGEYDTPKKPSKKRGNGTSWKQLERDVGLLVDGKRYPANQGGRVDVEGPDYVVQVKERKALSLEQITQLVEEIENIGWSRNKTGLVAIKVRRGKGKYSPILIIQSANQWVLHKAQKERPPLAEAAHTTDALMTALGIIKD